MNGSNLVTEADKKPFALCPICLRKLDKYFNIGYNGGLQNRYKAQIKAIKSFRNSSFERELSLFIGLQEALESDIEDSI